MPPRFMVPAPLFTPWSPQMNTFLIFTDPDFDGLFSIQTFILEKSLRKSQTCHGLNREVFRKQFSYNKVLFSFKSYKINSSRDIGQASEEHYLLSLVSIHSVPSASITVDRVSTTS